MAFGRQVQAGESLLVALGALILTRGVTVRGMWLHEGHLKEWARIVSPSMILEPSLVDVGPLNPCDHGGPSRGFAQASASPRSRSPALCSRLGPPSVSSASPPLAGLSGWAA